MKSHEMLRGDSTFFLEEAGVSPHLLSLVYASSFLYPPLWEPPLIVQRGGRPYLGIGKEN